MYNFPVLCELYSLQIIQKAFLVETQQLLNTFTKDGFGTDDGSPFSLTMDPSPLLPLFDIPVLPDGSQASTLASYERSS